MLNLGWLEMLVIGVIALLVVGPRELPGMLRTFGQYAGKARRMAREFQRSMEDAARDADGGAFDELRGVKRDFDKMARVDFAEQARRSADSLTGGKAAATRADSASATAAKANGAAATANGGPDLAKPGDAAPTPTPTPRSDPTPTASTPAASAAAGGAGATNGSAAAPASDQS